MSTNHITFRIISFVLTAIFVFQPLVFVTSVFAQDTEGNQAEGNTEGGGAASQGGGNTGGNTNGGTGGFGGGTAENAPGQPGQPEQSQSSPPGDPYGGSEGVVGGIGTVGSGTIGPGEVNGQVSGVGSLDTMDPETGKTPAEKAGGPNAVSPGNPNATAFGGQSGSLTNEQAISALMNSMVAPPGVVSKSGFVDLDSIKDKGFALGGLASIDAIAGMAEEGKKFANAKLLGVAKANMGYLQAKLSPEAFANVVASISDPNNPHNKSASALSTALVDQDPQAIANAVSASYGSAVAQAYMGSMVASGQITAQEASAALGSIGIGNQQASVATAQAPELEVNIAVIEQAMAQTPPQLSFSGFFSTIGLDGFLSVDEPAPQSPTSISDQEQVQAQPTESISLGTGPSVQSVQSMVALATQQFSVNPNFSVFNGEEDVAVTTPPDQGNFSFGTAASLAPSPPASVVENSQSVLNSSFTVDRTPLASFNLNSFQSNPEETTPLATGFFGAVTSSILGRLNEGLAIGAVLAGGFVGFHNIANFFSTTPVAPSLAENTEDPAAPTQATIDSQITNMVAQGVLPGLPSLTQQEVAPVTLDESIPSPPTISSVIDTTVAPALPAMENPVPTVEDVQAVFGLFKAFYDATPTIPAVKTVVEGTQVAIQAIVDLGTAALDVANAITNTATQLSTVAVNTVENFATPFATAVQIGQATATVIGDIAAIVTHVAEEIGEMLNPVNNQVTISFPTLGLAIQTTGTLGEAINAITGVPAEEQALVATQQVAVSIANQPVDPVKLAALAEALSTPNLNLQNALGVVQPAATAFLDSLTPSQIATLQNLEGKVFMSATGIPGYAGIVDGLRAFSQLNSSDPDAVKAAQQSKNSLSGLVSIAGMFMGSETPATPATPGAQSTPPAEAQTGLPSLPSAATPASIPSLPSPSITNEPASVQPESETISLSGEPVTGVETSQLESAAVVGEAAVGTQPQTGFFSDVTSFIDKFTPDISTPTGQIATGVKIGLTGASFAIGGPLGLAVGGISLAVGYAVNERESLQSFSTPSVASSILGKDMTAADVSSLFSSYDGTYGPPTPAVQQAVQSLQQAMEKNQAQTQAALQPSPMAIPGISITPGQAVPSF